MPRTDAIIAEFADHLAWCRTAYAGRPWDELTHLWLLGLEREQIVTVAYRRDIVERRLSGMPVSDAVRAAVARAVRWAWRDETMHALWIRGALLRRGRRRARLRAWLTSAEGAVAGWTSSRQHHYRWTDAPVRRGLAELVEAAGVVAGRIPAPVRAELHWQSFSTFCRFNVAAETTAAMGWARMAELGDGLCDPIDVRAFLRMEADERRHAALFQLFADAFGPDDRLRHGWELDRLLAEIGAIGQRFLARPQAGDRAWDNPLGKGATVYVRQGRAPSDRDAIVDALLTATVPSAAGKIAIATTFMMTVRRDDLSPAVDPALLRSVVRWLEARGADVAVLEAGNLYDRFHDGRTVLEVSRWLGLSDLPVVDAQSEQVPHAYLRGIGLETVARSWRDADVRITLGKLKSHPTTVAMLGLEALEGLGQRHDAYLFGDRQAERETANLMLMDAFPPDLALVDAWSRVPDGLLGMLGTPSARDPLRLYASTDAVALDAVLARHIGADPNDPRMLVASAMDWFGDPRPHTTVDGPDLPLPGFRGSARSPRTAALSRLALPVYQHASRRGALFVPEMDAAFPPRVSHGPAFRGLRRVVRRLVRDEGSLEPLLPVEEVRIDGRTVRLSRIGEGPPVVLLHGYPETLQLWSAVADRLAGRHEVVAFDWPGLGYSASFGECGPDARAGQLEAVLDALAIDRAIVVGTDMGGPPALLFADRCPERVAGVVVSNSLLFGDAPTSAAIAVMRRAGLADAAFSVAPGLVYRRCVETFLPRGVELPERIDLDFRGAFARSSVRRELAAMCRAYEAALPGLPDRYWRIRAPVLALWAEDDAHFPPDHGERLVRLVSAGRMQTLRGGHWMAWAQPAAVAAAIGTFAEDAWTSS